MVEPNGLEDDDGGIIPTFAGEFSKRDNSEPAKEKLMPLSKTTVDVAAVELGGGVEVT